MELRGKVVVDFKTKNLTKRILPGQIAVISHRDLDEIAAQALVDAKVKAVINAEPSITGKYPNQGPVVLAKASIPLIDQVGESIMQITEGDQVFIRNSEIWHNNQLIGRGKIMNQARLEILLEKTKKNIDYELNKFISNTLKYALKEKELIINNQVEYPEIVTNMQNRHVVIVVRGKGYKEDLLAIKPYIDEVKPILIGVDGGADALLEVGYKPDLIIGDMDSISDNALRAKAELIVHAYRDGQAPGIERLVKLGLKYNTFPAPGTSEDVAMLLAAEKGAELIVAVGTHTNMIDFLEKGRRGMASTFLVRLKIGPKLIDAKGVSKLYRPKVYLGHVAQIFIAGLVPIFVLVSVSSVLNQFWRILVLKLRLLIRF